MPDSRLERAVDSGSVEAVYIEDCDVSFTGSWEGRPFDGEHGGRMVVRKNKVKNQILGQPRLGLRLRRFTFSVVAYGNVFEIDDDAPAWSLQQLAAPTQFSRCTGLMYDNTWSIGADCCIGTPTMDLAIHRNKSDAGGNEHWLPCDGSYHRMCSNIDKNFGRVSGLYPRPQDGFRNCIDKVGAGTFVQVEGLLRIPGLYLCTADILTAVPANLHGVPRRLRAGRLPVLHAHWVRHPHATLPLGPVGQHLVRRRREQRLQLSAL